MDRLLSKRCLCKKGEIWLRENSFQEGERTSKCIGKESATKKIPGLRLEIEFCFARVPKMVSRSNDVEIKLVSCFCYQFLESYFELPSQNFHFNHPSQKYCWIRNKCDKWGSFTKK